MQAARNLLEFTEDCYSVPYNLVGLLLLNVVHSFTALHQCDSCKERVSAVKYRGIWGLDACHLPSTPPVGIVQNWCETFGCTLYVLYHEYPVTVVSSTFMWTKWIRSCGNGGQNLLYLVSFCSSEFWESSSTTPLCNVDWQSPTFLPTYCAFWDTAGAHSDIGLNKMHRFQCWILKNLRDLCTGEVSAPPLAIVIHKCTMLFYLWSWDVTFLLSCTLAWSSRELSLAFKIVSTHSLLGLVLFLDITVLFLALMILNDGVGPPAQSRGISKACSLSMLGKAVTSGSVLDGKTWPKWNVKKQSCII